MTPPFQPEIATYRDPDGREFGYVHLRHPGSDGLAVHFSAFFGKWGDAKPYRDRFQGYFHRLKMLGTSTDHDWLFLCDSHGPFDNGCYYAGEKGDLYVERAMTAMIEQAMSESEVTPDRVVMLGSSMGATAAIKFGLELDVAGIVAISPHIDLDISAAMQDRMAEVGWICPDGDPLAAHNHHLTRPIRGLLEGRPRSRGLPRLFLQSAVDDAGVHDEQVRPLVDQWESAGGVVHLDERPRGGHTSDYATRAVLLDAVARQLAAEPIDIDLYQTDPGFVGELTVPPLSSRLRRRLSLARKRILARTPPGASALAGSTAPATGR